MNLVYCVNCGLVSTRNSLPGCTLTLYKPVRGRLTVALGPTSVDTTCGVAVERLLALLDATLPMATLRAVPVVSGLPLAWPGAVPTATLLMPPVLPPALLTVEAPLPLTLCPALLPPRPITFCTGWPLAPTVVLLMVCAVIDTVLPALMV